MVAALVGLFSLLVGVSILLDRKARKNPFNIYLVFLAIPDFTFSLCCAVTCLMNASNQEYWSGWMCNFQNWYSVFGIGCNAWINACIARELTKMLQKGDRFRRYQPPSRSYVATQALCVYVMISFLGVWGAIDAPKWPFYAGTRSGLACLPVSPDRQSTLYFWLIFIPLFAGIPSVYIICVTINLWRLKLLPPSGKRRLLTIYFGRLILVFYVMWIPTVLTLFILTPYMSPLANFVGGLWSHLQGAVSAGLSLLKPDVYAAVRASMTCNYQLGAESRDQTSGSGEPSNDFSGAVRRSASSLTWPSWNRNTFIEAVMGESVQLQESRKSAYPGESSTELSSPNMIIARIDEHDSGEAGSEERLDEIALSALGP